MPTATISSEMAKRMSSYEKCHEKKSFYFNLKFQIPSLYMTRHNITLSIYDNICKQIQYKERYIMQTTRNRKRLLNLKFKYGMFRRIKRYHF